MPDATPFLAAIAATPDDDLPRLVYADWLDEHGHPDRAEFIRLQCHTARVGPFDPTWAPAKLREFDLFKANETRWLPSRLNAESRMLMVKWQRGFPACVDLADVADGRLTNGEWCNGTFHWMSSLDRPRRYPELSLGPVRKVRFSGGAHGIGILHHKLLRVVRSISLMEWYAGVGSDDLENFIAELADLSLDHFPELRTLDFRQGDLTLHAVERLANAPLFKHLTELRVSFPSALGSYAGPHLWREAVGRLFAAVAPQLERFELRSLPPFLVEEFSAVWWPQLRSLRIEHVHEDGLPFYDFSRTPKLTGLTILHQSGVGGGQFDVNPLQAFDDGWPEASLKMLALGSVPVEELKPWLAYPERFSLDFLSADVKGGRLRMEELTSYPLTRGLKGLAGSFTKTDLAPLANPTVLPELHTIWSGDTKPLPALRWRGGPRTTILRDAVNAARPTRHDWCGWYDTLMG